MIILLRERQIYVTPPKCASTAIHSYFASVPDVIWVNGPVGTEWAAVPHTTHVPGHYADFEVIMTVRDPHSRMESLWWHEKRYEKIERSFNEMVKQVLLSPNWFQQPLSWYEDHVKSTMMYKEAFDFLDIGSLTCCIPSMHRSLSYNDPGWTDELRTMVEKYWHEDFLRYEY